MDCTSIIQDYSFFVPQMLNKRNVGFSGILLIFIPGIALNATVHFFLWIKYLQSQVTGHHFHTFHFYLSNYWSYICIYIYVSYGRFDLTYILVLQYFGWWIIKEVANGYFGEHSFITNDWLKQSVNMTLIPVIQEPVIYQPAKPLDLIVHLIVIVIIRHSYLPYITDGLYIEMSNHQSFR